MTTLASIQERNKRHGGGAYIVLLECTLPSGTVFRLANNTEDIEWPSGSGTTWLSMGFGLDEIEENNTGEQRGVSVRVSDPSTALLRYVKELEAWRKANGRERCRVRLVVINCNLLDQTSPEAEWHFEDKGMAMPHPMNELQIRLSVCNIFSRPIPRRNHLRDFCSWTRTEECPHVGECDRTLATCREVYHNEINFGGFPLVEKGAIYA